MHFPLGFVPEILSSVVGWMSDSGNSGNRDHLISHSTIKEINAVRQRWGIPGMSVAVVTSQSFHSHHHDGDGVQLLNFGTATNDGRPVDSDSLFCIASNSKLFTALSVLKMIDDGVTLPSGTLLTLATKVKDVLPEWGLMDEYAASTADIADLMSMRSGMPSHDFAYDYVLPAETVANLARLRPSAEFRQVFQYQNSHYVALAHMVPTLTGVPFIQYVAKHFFAPLGMSATTYNHTAAAASGHRTDGHTHTRLNITECVAKSTLANHKNRPRSCHGSIAPFGWFTDTDGIDIAGAGGIISSARDVARWLAELLDPQVVPARLLAAAAEPRIVMGSKSMPGADGLPSLYGAGQFIHSYRGHRVVSHTGGVPGQQTLIARLPEAGMAVAVLTNDADFGPYAFHTVFAAIVDNMLGLKPLDVETEWFRQYTANAFGPIKKNGAEPAYGFGAVPGRYEGAGYGTLKLEPINHSDAIHARFPLELARFGMASEHVFVAPYYRIFATHLVFSHWDGPYFNWTVFIARHPDQGFGKGTQTNGPAIITPRGIGMFGGFSVPGEGAPHKHIAVETCEEESEVWFARK
ncbi:hypothetical protein CspHIS471_0109460 [Cutaneotrichosporon sp. HIS471]|nr:hypothetical protein CspHIS471_0109460 [Cutaneotrichosporon sp. HIS471]